MQETRPDGAGGNRKCDAGDKAQNHRGAATESLVEGYAPQGIRDVRRALRLLRQEIDITEMQVDHVQAVYLGGKDELENYRPACRQCNFYKSTMSVEGLREQLSLIPGRLEKLLIFRLALAHGLVRITGKPVKFYFEEREKQC